MSEEFEKTQFEKMLDCSVQFAKIITTHYEELIANGMSEENAMILTIKYQDAVLRKRSSEGE